MGNISLLDDVKEQSSLALSTAKKEFKEFLGPGAECKNSKSLVFLQRNRERTTQQKRWNENLEVDNRLEAKICMTTFQMFFVSGSEDYFYRKNALGKKRTFKKRAERMDRWNKQVQSRVQG